MATQLISRMSWRQGERCRRGVRIAAVALLVAVTAPVAGQVPDVQARDAAALAPPGYEDEPVWETAIAAGGDTVLFNVDLRNGPT